MRVHGLMLTNRSYVETRIPGAIEFVSFVQCVQFVVSEVGVRDVAHHLCASMPTGTTCPASERSQEVQDRLLLLVGKRVESLYHRVGFGWPVAWRM
jgi:hypothetical protein